MLTKGMGYLIAALALGLLTACGVMWWLWGTVDAQRIDLDRERAAVKALSVDLRKCREANAGWQSALDTVQATLSSCVGDRDAARADAARALEASRASARQIDADAQRFRARLISAQSDADCKATLEATLCPAVGDY